MHNAHTDLPVPNLTEVKINQLLSTGGWTAHRAFSLVVTVVDECQEEL